MKSYAALYCRLSKDDEQEGESTSISSQKLILEQYCKEKRLEIFDYYIDDGFSGLSYDRPAFLRLLDDIDAGKINLVITKDLSRLGRDYIMTGYFTDIYFPKKNIRYVAINDGIDTQHDNNDIAPFKNIMNDMYAKDISRKIKTAKRQRAYQGMHIGAQVPYGYKKDPLNTNKLIIDESAAKVVRMIFNLASEEKSLAEICCALHDLKIPTPSVYKAYTGDTRYANSLNKTPEEQLNWNRYSISKILNDPVYLGSMVNHKCEVINYKTKEKRNIPKENWIVVPDTHDSIIETEIYVKVQNLLNNRKHAPHHHFENLLHGKVYCSSCQHLLSLQMKKSKAGYKPYLRCIHGYKNPSECNGYRQIAYEKLIQLVIDQINTELSEKGLPVPVISSAFIQRHVKKILVGKYEQDGTQNITIELIAVEKEKNTKRSFSWFPNI